MFVQIHMLQSLPPGNVNRDDRGQPKMCMFGGVTRGRISSQAQKRAIRFSQEFADAFGSALGSRTRYLPQMVADEVKRLSPATKNDELDKIKAALAAQFKKEKKGRTQDEDDGRGEENLSESDGAADGDGATGCTGQIVFISQPFAAEAAEQLANFRTADPKAYRMFLGDRTERGTSKSDQDALKKTVDRLIENIGVASKSLTVDIGLFGRMTTSDLVVDVEAACQVAHAISTHEVITENDYFTAADDLQKRYASGQVGRAGAGFVSDEGFFNSAVYYKYLNADLDALQKHLQSEGARGAARAGAALLKAAACANPTGKQNSFAAHGVTELILVEVSRIRRPMSYANAFLQAVEGGRGRNLMTESVRALYEYIDSVAGAFAPSDTRRALLAIGGASRPQLPKTAHIQVATLDEAASWLEGAAVPAGQKAKS